MTPTLDAPAVLLVNVLPEAPACPTAAPSAPVPTSTPCPTTLPPTTAGSLLAAWARATCPNLRDGRCVAEHARGRQRCNLLLDKPKRCPWAERGPVLSAPEAVYRAYLSMAGGPWWKRTRPSSSWPEPTPEAAPAPVAAPVEALAVEVEKPKRDDTPPNPHATVEGACLAAGRVVERLCPRCATVPLAPRKKVCDPCRAGALRASRRRRQASYREKEPGADGL